MMGNTILTLLLLGMVEIKGELNCPGTLDPIDASSEDITIWKDFDETNLREDVFSSIPIPIEDATILMIWDRRPNSYMAFFSMDTEDVNSYLQVFQDPFRPPMATRYNPNAGDVNIELPNLLCDAAFTQFSTLPGVRGAVTGMTLTFCLLDPVPCVDPNCALCYNETVCEECLDGYHLSGSADCVANEIEGDTEILAATSPDAFATWNDGSENMAAKVLGDDPFLVAVGDTFTVWDLRQDTILSSFSLFVGNIRRVNIQVFNIRPNGTEEVFTDEWEAPNGIGRLTGPVPNLPCDKVQVTVVDVRDPVLSSFIAHVHFESIVAVTCTPEGPGPFDDTCPNKCRTDLLCDVDHSCQRAPCGGCRCFLVSPDPPDCCYDEDSGCTRDCQFHGDCGGGNGNELCKPDPDCTGGCICDAGEPRGCVTDPNKHPDCPSDFCSTDADCPSEGDVCFRNDCGGCVCALRVEKACCPDLYRDADTCEVGCEFHRDCPGDQVCVRNDCGGCGCQDFDPVNKAPWADCFANPKQTACADDCRKHSSCDEVRPGSVCTDAVCSRGCECIST